MHGEDYSVAIKMRAACAGSYGLEVCFSWKMVARNTGPRIAGNGRGMTPEAKARQTIDALLTQAGWHVCNVLDVSI